MKALDVELVAAIRAAVRAELEAQRAAPVVLGMKRAGQLLDVSERTMWRLVRTGALRTVLVAGRQKVPMTEIVRLGTLPAQPEPKARKAMVTKPAARGYSAAAEVEAMRRRRAARR